MEYLSVNDMEFKTAAYKKGTDDIITSINSVDTSNTTGTLINIKTRDDEIESEIKQYRGLNMMWASTIILSFVVWIVCIISLVLNIVRKNVGKAVFSGIGLLIPIIAIFMSSTGRILSMSGMALGSIISYAALLIEIITLILSFIFCFSKNKKEVNQ